MYKLRTDRGDYDLLEDCVQSTLTKVLLQVSAATRKRCLRPIHGASLPLFLSFSKQHIRVQNCFVAGFFVIALRPATLFDSGEMSLQFVTCSGARCRFSMEAIHTCSAGRNEVTAVINYLFCSTICAIHSNMGSSGGLARTKRQSFVDNAQGQATRLTSGPLHTLNGT